MYNILDMPTERLVQQKYGHLQQGHANSPDHNLLWDEILSEYRPSDTAIRSYFSISDYKIVYDGKHTHAKKNQNLLYSIVAVWQFFSFIRFSKISYKFIASYE